MAAKRSTVWRPFGFCRYYRGIHIWIEDVGRDPRRRWRWTVFPDDSDTLGGTAPTKRVAMRRAEREVDRLVRSGKGFV